MLINQDFQEYMFINDSFSVTGQVSEAIYRSVWQLDFGGQSLFGFIIEAHLSITYKLDLVDSTGRQKSFSQTLHNTRISILPTVLAVPLEIK